LKDNELEEDVLGKVTSQGDFKVISDCSYSTAGIRSSVTVTVDIFFTIFLKNYQFTNLHHLTFQ